MQHVYCMGVQLYAIPITLTFSCSPPISICHWMEQLSVILARKHKICTTKFDYCVYYHIIQTNFLVRSKAIDANRISRNLIGFSLYQCDRLWLLLSTKPNQAYRAKFCLWFAFVCSYRISWISKERRCTKVIVVKNGHNFGTSWQNVSIHSHIYPIVGFIFLVYQHFIGQLLHH